MTLIYAISSKTERHFYIQGTLQNGWSRNILSMQIETNRLEDALPENLQTALPTIEELVGDFL